MHIVQLHYTVILKHNPTVVDVLVGVYLLFLCVLPIPNKYRRMPLHFGCAVHGWIIERAPERDAKRPQTTRPRGLTLLRVSFGLGVLLLCKSGGGSFHTSVPRGPSCHNLSVVLPGSLRTV